MSNETDDNRIMDAINILVAKEGDHLEDLKISSIAAQIDVSHAISTSSETTRS